MFIEDFLTCLGVREGAYRESYYKREAKPLTLACAFHDCSCSFQTNSSYYSFFDATEAMTSNITVLGTHYALSAPLLDLRFSYDSGSEHASPPLSPDLLNITDGMTASEFWSSGSFNRSDYEIYAFNESTSVPVMSLFKNSAYSERFVKETGVCIASEAYSWGFSSLLLLTFCAYTLAFAATLITLQSEVYLASRFDRQHLSYSIYADILIIAETLRSIPEHDLLGLLHSPKALDKKLVGRKHGIRFDTSGLPSTRWKETAGIWEERLMRPVR